MGSSVMKQFKFFDFHVPVVQLFFVLRKSCKKNVPWSTKTGRRLFYLKFKVKLSHTIR